MPSKYSVIEPHPTASTYLYSGRGGAGNTFRAPKTTSGASAQGPASLFSNGLPQTKSKFSSGRGGAGNIHPHSERAIFSFDEELERQTTRQRRIEQEGATYHVGRGGAGNYTSAWSGSSSSSSSSRKDSSSSAGSERSGFFGRLSNTFERR